MEIDYQKTLKKLHQGEQEIINTEIKVYKQAVTAIVQMLLSLDNYKFSFDKYYDYDLLYLDNEADFELMKEELDKLPYLSIRIPSSLYSNDGFIDFNITGARLLNGNYFKTILKEHQNDTIDLWKLASSEFHQPEYNLHLIGYKNNCMKEEELCLSDIIGNDNLLPIITLAKEMCSSIIKGPYQY